jgi:acyl carrier protein
MNIEQLVKELVSRQLDVPVEKIENHHSFIEDLGGDSLDTVEMVLELEDDLNIVVEDEVAENLRTVQMVIDYLNTLNLTV